MSAGAMNRILTGDCREIMRELIERGVRVRMCVTSPPYWGLRDYGVKGQIGLEPTIADYVDSLVEVFRLVRDLLADDGTLWMNLGDSYASPPGGGGHQGKGGQRASRSFTATGASKKGLGGLKPKDLCMIPARVALALQADGWYLRQDIVWSKPNPMPESVRDRCTKSHEYVFMLAKSERYYYDQDAIAEPASGTAHARVAGYKTPDGWDTSRGNGSHGSYHHAGREDGHLNYEPRARHNSAAARKSRASADAKSAPTDDRNGMRSPGVGPKASAAGGGVKYNDSFSAAITDLVDRRNRRSVWTIPTQAFPDAHFATFPEALVEPCILAGSRPGDVVLDPFMGSGTVARVALRLGRRYLGCELNPEYVGMSEERTRVSGALPFGVTT